MRTLLPNDWGMRVLLVTVQAQASLSAGDIEGAQRATARGRQLAAHGRMPPWWPSLLKALDAMVLAERGHVREARSLLDQPADGPEFHLATCFRACVLLRADDPAATIATIDGIPTDRLFPHVSGVVEALRAQALMATGDRAGAHAALERSLHTAHRFGLVEQFRLVGDRTRAAADRTPAHRVQAPGAHRPGPRPHVDPHARGQRLGGHPHPARADHPALPGDGHVATRRSRRRSSSR